MAPPRLALTPALPSELLTFILSHHNYPTTLIICQPRATFLSSLLTCVPSPCTPLEDEEPPPADEEPSLPNPFHPTKSPFVHQLLIPNLHQISASRYTNLVFIFTVSHLRAYLAAFGTDLANEKGKGKESPPGTGLDKQRRRKWPLLVVYGLVELHRDTSEWSAQGMGNSLAGLVEAGWRCRKKIVLVEERKNSREPQVMDAEGGERDEEEISLSKCWEERLPMLNGSVRRAGLESEDGGWGGRTVELGRVLSRWFRFGRGEWNTQKES